MNSSVGFNQKVVNFFCVPHAGGASTFFHDWQNHLPCVTVSPVHLPGRETRYSDPLINNLEAMVNLLWQEKKEKFLKPYVLFGHSMGARIAYELAKKASLNNYPEPECLIVSGARAPQFEKKTSENQHDLPEQELIQKLKASGATPDVILSEKMLLSIYLPIIRSDYELIEKAPVDLEENTLSCPVLVYGGDADPGVSQEQLQGWQSKTSNRCVIRTYPGGHFYLTENKDTFLAAVNEDIAMVFNRLCKVPLTEKSKEDDFIC